MGISPPGGPTATPVPATVLVDTGITKMFITNAPDLLPHGMPADSSVAVTVGTAPGHSLGYSFLSGPEGGGSPPAVGQAPSKVSHLDGQSGVFVNTGRHVLFGDDYLFDARHGAVGFQPLVASLR